jgi:hypothetical protein
MPTYLRQSSWQAVIAVKEILAVCRAFAGARLAAATHFCQQGCPGFFVGHGMYRHEPNSGVAVAGQYHLVPGLCAADEIG